MVSKKWMIATLAITLAVGACGDGQNKKRQPLRKGQPAPGVQSFKGTNGGINSQQQQKALKEKGDQEKRLDGMIQQYTSGAELKKDDLADGVYKLKSVVTNLKYMKGSNWVRIFRAQSIQLDAQKYPVLSNEATEGMGLDSNNIDPNGRQFEIPMAFTVQKQNNIFSADRDAFQGYMILTTRGKATMSPKGDTTHEMDNDVTGMDPGAASPKASLQNLLSAQSLSTTDRSAKIEMRLRKASENRMHVTFDVVESDVLVRTVVLVYEVEKLPAVTATNASANAQSSNAMAVEPRADAPPATGAEAGDGAAAAAELQ